MIERLKRFGVDAPYVIRNLLLVGIIALLGSFLSFFVQSETWFWIIFSQTSLLSLSMLITAFLMLISSLYIKPRLLSRLVKDLKLKGTERVLDLGCGRGMFLILAAKHLPGGKAYGVDLWKVKDQSGNALNVFLKNIHSEHLEKSVEVATGDICALSYPSDHFDVVISSLTLHNLADPNKAIDELLRVLKPGGQFAIFDILSVQKYGQYLKAKSEIAHTKQVFYCPKGTILLGKKQMTHL